MTAVKALASFHSVRLIWAPADSVELQVTRRCLRLVSSLPPLVLLGPNHLQLNQFMGCTWTDGMVTQAFWLQPNTYFTNLSILDCSFCSEPLQEGFKDPCRSTYWSLGPELTLSRGRGYNCLLHFFNASSEEHSWRLYSFVRYVQ